MQVTARKYEVKYYLSLPYIQHASQRLAGHTSGLVKMRLQAERSSQAILRWSTLNESVFTYLVLCRHIKRSLLP